MYDFTGKVALVTGAYHKRGLGHAIALRLARDGANVAVSDRASESSRSEDKHEGWRGLESVVEEIESLGRQALAVTADITDTKEIAEMVKRILDRFGRIDILVNNAGTVGKRGVPILDMNERDWKLPLDVNLTGTFLCSKAIAREMVRQEEGGKIVTIASMEAKLTLSGDRAAYIASKAGLVGFIQALALELAPHKINVNAICPGGVNTGLVSESISAEATHKGISIEQATEEYYAQFIAVVPLGRLGMPEDIANTVVFLASSESAYITGQAIGVNGGWGMER
jgi:NAD(P)-dependent dehydrogenase (short-subunit alcohol dehydrogenase family)